ncbi:hypothetical protein [Methanolobus sp. WCC4]|uniref:hypothetical protein n=1 Tax=Methanolobus sp. WCC4 TaxID=3125784 RepID=UPI0030F6C17D
MIKQDFTLKEYSLLLDSIKATDYEICNFQSYLRISPEKCLILRHDVDREIKRALEMASLEYEKNISSTYFFRYNKDVFVPTAIQEIEDMGHEIGYHYEVMDKAKGDVRTAAEIFKKELDYFREIADVNTVCMHGNPLASWSNRDMWKSYDLSQFDLLGEPYLSIDYDKVVYLTDTGRKWNNSNVRVKDIVSSELANKDYIRNIRSTNDIIELIKSSKVPQICILVHPNRWCDDFAGWTKELLFQNIKNIGKFMIVYYRSMV